jgi:hypothetical protein
MVVKDLALMTELTLQEASDFVGALEGGHLPPVDVHPYDALPELIRLVVGIRGYDPAQGAGYALNRLMRGAPLTDPVARKAQLERP